MAITTSPKWITIAEAATRLSLSTKTVRRMISRGDLPARRIGPRLIRVDARSCASRAPTHGPQDLTLDTDRAPQDG
jgi:excisionase family DNA binding protein